MTCLGLFKGQLAPLCFAMQGAYETLLRSHILAFWNLLINWPSLAFCSISDVCLTSEQDHLKELPPLVCWKMLNNQLLEGWQGKWICSIFWFSCCKYSYPDWFWLSKKCHWRKKWKHPAGSNSTGFMKIETVPIHSSPLWSSLSCHLSSTAPKWGTSSSLLVIPRHQIPWVFFLVASKAFCTILFLFSSFCIFLFHFCLRKNVPCLFSDFSPSTRRSSTHLPLQPPPLFWLSSIYKHMCSLPSLEAFPWLSVLLQVTESTSSPRLKTTCTPGSPPLTILMKWLSGLLSRG